MVFDGCMACGYCWGLVPTLARIFPTKSLFRVLPLTGRGNIGVISGVILLKYSFSRCLYLYYWVIWGNITVILPYPPCPYKGRGKVICNSISRGDEDY